jgi:hypothetical protein
MSASQACHRTCEGLDLTFLQGVHYALQPRMSVPLSGSNQAKDYAAGRYFLNQDYQMAHPRK